MEKFEFSMLLYVTYLFTMQYFSTKIPHFLILRMEVSRSMKPELLAFFKQPMDQLTEYMKRVKSVLDFQAQQRQSWQKKMNEKVRNTHSERSLVLSDE